jgi:hypothetical protein
MHLEDHVEERIVVCLLILVLQIIRELKEALMGMPNEFKKLSGNKY